MKVQFDLRLIDMVEKERKKKSFNATRLVAILLMMAFFISSGAYLALMTIQSFGMQDRVDDLQSRLAALRVENASLTGQLNVLRAREAVFANALRIMNDDLPTIEVLSVLETNMDLFGIGFDTMRFLHTPAEGNVVEVVGLVASDRQIIEFSDRLRLSGVFNNVSLPVTTLNPNTGMVSFTLRMPVRAIGEINVGNVSSVN
jgi:hypothetical protein